MAKPYNGFPSWNAWNVSLWINNDEGLYRMAREYVQSYGYDKAVRLIYRAIGESRTPDGAKYSARSIRLAIRGIID
jgi:hypothetical protein